MNHPRMTSSGRRWAFLIGALIAFALPKRIEHTAGRCTTYAIEPWGLSLIEHVTGELGVAYSRGEDCR